MTGAGVASGPLSRRTFLAGTGAALTTAYSTRAGAKASRPRPNIVFIMADDLGYADLSLRRAARLRDPAP